jgi:hypothetical protein
MEKLKKDGLTILIGALLSFLIYYTMYAIQFRDTNTKEIDKKINERPTRIEVESKINEKAKVLDDKIEANRLSQQQQNQMILEYCKSIDGNVKALMEMNNKKR